MDYLAFDLGAESGRAVRGSLKGGRLELEIIHRFSSRSVLLPDGLHWDILYQFSEIKNGLSIYRQKYGTNLVGISCDSWGVDYGLLDRNDCLVSNPYHYRDHRTDGVAEKAFQKISFQEIYQQTGIQFMSINTIFQLYSMVLDDSPLLSASKTFLMIADLFNFFLSGEKAQEFTLATTSQLFNPVSHTWAKPIFERLSLPFHIMPQICQPATIIGKLNPAVAEETGLFRVSVIAGASHDTAAAVAACPARKGENFAYLSSGTWSLFGAELVKPLINDAAREAGFTNEGGVGNTIRFLKNITGLWILQECRRQWEREGESLSYPTLVEMAEKAPPFLAVIDVNDPSFLAPKDMVAAIATYCEKTGQRKPEKKGEFVRVILESLALSYRKVLNDLNRVIPERGKIEVLYIMGGGSQNRLLNQFAANACGIPVIAGPVEATAAGNILTQALATGALGSWQEIREIIHNSFPLTTYQPEDSDAWFSAGERLKGLP